MVQTYTNSTLESMCCENDGITISAVNVGVITGGHKRLDDVKLTIEPGELVAIVGCSGAGKSTLLKVLCGNLCPNNGKVLVNGNDLYENSDFLKRVLAYVPQHDIVLDDLTVYEMVMSSACLRTSRGTTHSERERLVNIAIETVDLEKKKHCLIKNLSGGQRKRASIAVELVANPQVIFLDEPCSGLDPLTEKGLMTSLRKMADAGKTIILVTHSTLFLTMCDKIALLGSGGQLCYYGSYRNASAFFRPSSFLREDTDGIIDIYSALYNNSSVYKDRFDRIRDDSYMVHPSPIIMNKRSSNVFHFFTLVSRNFKLLKNNVGGTCFLCIFMPLAIILCIFPLLTHKNEQYELFEITKNIFYALSCSACFLGAFISLKSISNEQGTLMREYKTGLSIIAYVLSKISMFAVLSLIQGTVISLAFAKAVGLPATEKAILFANQPFKEIWISTLLLTYASQIAGMLCSAIGVVVSRKYSRFECNDVIYTGAVIFLLLQILASGIIFSFPDNLQFLTSCVVCRWAMESFGSIADFNQLQYSLQKAGYLIAHEKDIMYLHTGEHLLKTWGCLFIFIVGFTVATMLVLKCSLDKDYE